MTHFAITTIGTDRPGMVAAVSGSLSREGCNLEDSTMSILGGQFAILLVIDAPATETVAGLQAALAEPARDHGLIVHVTQVADDPDTADRTSLWTVAVYGADKPGIVHGITTLLADAGANICDMSTRVTGDTPERLYAMVIDIELPPDADAVELGRLLDERATVLGVKASIHASDADML